MMNYEKLARRSSLYWIGYRSALAAVAVAWLAASAPLRGDDPAASADQTASANAAPPHAEGVSLLARDSLAGWEYRKKPEGWTIKDGRLTAGEHTTPLESCWMLGDFDLFVRWTVPADKPDAEWRIVMRLPARVSGPRISDWTLSAGSNCGRLRLDGQELFAGTAASIQGTSSTARLSRRGKSAEIAVGDHVHKVDGMLPVGCHLILENSHGGTIEELRLVERRGESIFNGKDLNGWWTPGFLGSWRAENGELACLNLLGNYLRTEKEYGDFTLSLEYLAAKGCNSGIGIRTPHDGWPSGDGVELQIYDHPGLDKQSTMALYGNLEPLTRADRSEEWNRVVVKMQRSTISAWMNGELVQHADFRELPELKHRPRKGWIGFQDHGGKIRFRDIRVDVDDYSHGVPLPIPGPPSAIPALLDRLMSSTQLADLHGVRTDTVASPNGAGDRIVLADITGPGALVRVWRAADDGCVALYFDDEPEPRVECAWAELFDRLPALSEERQPLLTCVPYERRLRIVLADAEPGLYRVDYVHFPRRLREASVGSSDVGDQDARVHELAASLGIQSFRDTSISLPRGWLSAIDYRQHQFGNGRHREHDVHSRKDGEPHTLSPGGRATLLEIDGGREGGEVLWWKLATDLRVLANDDLWLEISDSRPERPLIVGPARYLFAPLAAGAGHSNFVVLNSDGPTSFLAIPYGERMRVTAENRGQQSIGPIRLSASFERRETISDAFRGSRLVARFIPAGTPGPLVEQSGPGRWIGLVCQMPKEGTLGIKRLVVDGDERPGWQAENLDPFLGRPTGLAEFYRPTSGHAGGLAWRWLLMEAVNFNKSLALEANDGDAVGDRLAWFYVLAEELKERRD